MSIYVNVTNQKISIASSFSNVVAGSQEFVKFKFNLDNEWNGLTVFAQFGQNGIAYNKYLTSENDVFLPAEIAPGKCTLMLYGSKGTTIATSNYLTLTIDKNILVSDAQSTEITQSLYNQLITKIDAEISQAAIAQKVDRVTKDVIAEYVRDGKITAMTLGDGSLPREKVDAKFEETLKRADGALQKAQAEYRLVNDITLSEDVSELKVTKDDNGAPLKLKDMFMLYIGETTLTGSHTIFFNSEHGVKYYMYKTYNFPAGICGLFCDVRKLYDMPPIDKYLYLTLMPDRVLSQVSPDAIQGLSGTHAGATVDITFRDIDDGKHNLTNITTLWLGMPTAEINKGFKFKAGSRIRIYGIDAE